jgi:hypothetical protein
MRYKTLDNYYIDHKGSIIKVKIGAKANLYKGFLQGYKVFIDGKKYPKKRGFYYTSMNIDKCIKYAINDYINK